MRFRDQETILYRFLALPNLRRACIDSTGIGSQLAEDAQITFGLSKVECVTFTNKSKEEMAYQLYTAVEDRLLLIDINTSDAAIEDYHSVKKSKTDSNNIRFEDDGSSDGHADRFWSLALANHAATSKNDYQKPTIISGKPYEGMAFDNLHDLRAIERPSSGVRFETGKAA
jgi:phage FluMu gp28-like protein